MSKSNEIILIVSMLLILLHIVTNTIRNDRQDKYMMLLNQRTEKLEGIVLKKIYNSTAIRFNYNYRDLERR